MNKLLFSKMTFCIIITAVFWNGWIQAQPLEAELNSTAEVGRDNPFANFLADAKSASRKISQTSQEEKPELFLETITLKSLSAESFKNLIEGMSSPYGTVSIDKNSNTLIIYDTKEALEKMRELVPAKEVVTENLVSRSYRIVYADIKEVERTLKTFISKSGQLSANPSTGNILVVDFESNIKVIDSFVMEIDRLMHQVLVEVRIYDVTATEGFDIGAEWDAGRNNPITVIGNTKTINELTGTTTVDTTTKTTTNAWQTNDAGLPASLSGSTSSFLHRKSNPFVGGTFDAGNSIGSIRLGLLDTVNVDIVLNILRNQVGAKLLANPRILVLDNETAKFKIISEIPYTEQSDTSEGGSLTSTAFKEVGVELQVTPHVTREGMIRLHIMPTFSVVSELGDIIPNAGATARSVPTIDSREIDTKALVKDGQTVVIGGLRKREVSQDVSKIPFLGDVPILGHLFSNTSEEVKTNELLIFITPKIIVEPTLSANELKGLKATDFSDPKPLDTEFEKAEKSGK
ncbi:MAG: hypothetical protein JW947_06955 [Sedimentisphaerales bacterium]|nr:hypothetical protein [Sedimentisphaerales bacterium]